MSKRLTTSEFVERAKLVHEINYDYTRVNYLNNHTKVEIVCPKHGTFLANPIHFLKGADCPKCAHALQAEKHKIKDFAERANLVHGNLYDYSKVVYNKNNSKVEIICPIHGSFWQTPAGHLNGNGCPICGIEKREENKRQEQENIFIAEASKYYDCSKVIYFDNQTEVTLICKKHGEFKISPAAFKRGNICPLCAKEIPANVSLGEIKVASFFKEHNIKFQRNVIFEKCRDINPLPFDFYLEEKNLLIEYNGIQHYKAVRHFGGKEAFELQKKHDLIKEEFARENGFILLAISYKENLEKILSNIL